MAELFEELKRRHIYRIAAAYIVAAWLLLQLFNNIIPVITVPHWMGMVLLILLIAGFPFALIFGWSLDSNAARNGGDTAANPSPAKIPPAKEPAADASVSPAIAADGPSLVVLPFANMSGDAAQDVFADGLTEDILTELSRFKSLFIISRNTAFQYKGRAVDVRQVARELGVKYVVEGSVRKLGSRVRVTVQLIDGRVDHHIWAERYDRELKDIFELQDEVTSAIVATLTGRVEAAAGEHAGRKPTENMNAYECLLAGKLAHHRSTKADNQKALAFLDRAIALDPNYAQAHAWKACVLGQAWVNGYNPGTSTSAVIKQTMDELNAALALNSNDSDVHRILAAVYLVQGEHDKALYHQQRALSLNPNDDLIVVQQGEILTWLGRAEEGIAWIEKAMRLNPCHPERYWNHLARAYFVAHRYDEALSAISHITAPDHTHCTCFAACYAKLGNEDAAHKAAEDVLRHDPRFSVAVFMRTMHYKRPEDEAHHRDALLKAGLPEHRTGSAAREAVAGD